jgi:twitching motility two-component system response regulator PilH
VSSVFSGDFRAIDKHTAKEKEMEISKVLVVDDSTADLMNIKNIVAEAGYNVITACSGVEAIEKAKSQKPDLILMDIVMDETDGYEACRRLTKDGDTKNIPVVFVSSKNQKADRVWAELQGGKGLIGKPFTADQIVSQIKAFN